MTPTLIAASNRRYKAQEPISRPFDDYNGKLKGFSFRQLVSTANNSIRQYSDDGSEFQDVGFVDGYIDEASVSNFANGGRTYFEQFNQFNNQLEATNSNNSLRPEITNSSGEIYKDNGKVIGFRDWNNYLQFVPDFPPLTVGFYMVKNDERPFSLGTGASNGEYFMLGQSGSSSTGVDNSAGSPIYSKNGKIISPRTRGGMYNAIKNIKAQITITDLDLEAWTILKGEYTGSTSFDSVRYQQEELYFDQAQLTTNEIEAIGVEQQEFYLTQKQKQQ